MTKRNLEVLRALKNRMVRLFTRVETIRELLERLLDDDSDMRDMNLTAKCAPAAPPSAGGRSAAVYIYPCIPLYPSAAVFDVS